MMSENIIYRVSAVPGDLSGLKQVESILSRIEASSKRIAETMAKWGGSAQPITMTAASGGGAGGVTYTGGAGGGGRRGASPSGAARYDLNSPGGVVQYEEQVLIPAQQMLRGASTTQAASTTSRIRARTFRGSLAEQLGYRYEAVTTQPNPQLAKLLSKFKTNSAPGTSDYYLDFLNWAERNKNALPSALEQARQEALEKALGWNGTPQDLNAPKQFYELVQQAIQPQTTMQLVAPNRAQMLGQWAGQMLNRLPMLSAVGGIMWGARQFTQGYQLWQQTSGSFDQIAHSLSLTATSVEKFRAQVSAAGAQFGWSLQQTAQAASLLTQSFGNLNSQGLANLTSGVASFGLMNGLSSQQATQIVGASATMGITAGVGSVMNPKQFGDMITNMAQIGGMQGRQGQMATGLLSLYSNVLQTTPIVPNPTLLAGMYTQLSRTGIRAFQGTSGAQVLESLNQAIASGNMQGIGLAAIEHTLGKNASKYSAVQLLEALQQGLSGYVPGTHTTIGASVMQYLHTLSPDQAALILSQGTGLSLDYAKQLLQIRNFGTYAAPTTTPHTGQRGGRPRMSLYDRNRAAEARKQLQESELGIVGAHTSTWWNDLGEWGQFAAVGLGSALAPSLLRRMIVGGGGGSLIRGAGAAIRTVGRVGLRASGALLRGTGAAIRTIGRAGIRAGSSLLRGIGRIGGRALGSIGRLLGGAGLEEGVGAAAEVAGDALDMTGIGAIAGIPLDIIGAALMGGGAGFALSHLFGGHKSSSKPSAAHAVASRTASWQISNLLVDKLQINQIDITGSINSKGGSLSAITKTGSTNQNPFGLMSYDPMTNSLFKPNTIPGYATYGSGYVSGGTAAQVGGNSNVSKIWNFLASKGLSPVAIAGILGNLQQESGLHPTAVNPQSGAYGIAQWLGPRYQALLQFAAQHHESASDLTTQLQFLWQELQSGQDGSVKVLNSQTSPSSAAEYFEQYYERGGNGPDVMMQNRMNYAQQYYNDYVQAVQGSNPSANVSARQVELGPKTVNNLAAAFKQAMRNGTGLSPHTGPVNAYV